MRERRTIPTELLTDASGGAFVRLVTPHRVRLDGGVLWTLSRGEDDQTLAWECYEDEETAMVPFTVGVGSIDGIRRILQCLSASCPDDDACVRWGPRDVDRGCSAMGPMGQPIRCIAGTDIVRVLLCWFMTPPGGPLAPHPKPPLERFNVAFRRRYEQLLHAHDHEAPRCIEADTDTVRALAEDAELRARLVLRLRYPLRCHSPE